MATRDTAETRSVTLVDLPLVRRLSEQGTVLDSELLYTRAAGGPQGARFFSLLLPYSGVHTLVTRSDQHDIVGQFRLRGEQHHAHITYLAPTLNETDSDTPWLLTLDRMAVEAGKRGAHMLVAEIGELAPLFKTLRQASYSIYARQEIWYHPPIAKINSTDVTLQVVAETDQTEISSFVGNIVPRLVQPIEELPRQGQSLLYYKAGELYGYINIAEGKHGLYLMPLLHPDAFRDAAAVLTAAIAHHQRSRSAPIYVRVRRYQDWLDEALQELGFTLCGHQAVMVKHIAAGVRSAAFASLAERLEALPAQQPNGVPER